MLEKQKDLREFEIQLTKDAYKVMYSRAKYHSSNVKDFMQALIEEYVSLDEDDEKYKYLAKHLQEKREFLQIQLNLLTTYAKLLSENNRGQQAIDVLKNGMKMLGLDADGLFIKG